MMAGTEWILGLCRPCGFLEYLLMSSPDSYALTEEDVQRVFSTVEIPACPVVVTRVLQEANREDPDLKRIAKEISSDVGMSAITIKLANSPLFRGGAATSNISRALERLGTRNVVSIVVAAGLRASMTGLPAEFIEQFWARSSAVATAAGMIARKHYAIAPDTAYTYALFHDAAIPLMMRRFPNYVEVIEESRRKSILLINAEEGYFPCTHPIVGSLLVRNWGLPSIIGQAIRFHHEADVYDLPDKTLPGIAVALIATTQIAEHLASKIFGEIDLEVGERLFGHALEHLGITEADLEALHDDFEHLFADAGH